jgi:putative tryptophan/tyrosine transport system substrate-binding protein
MAAAPLFRRELRRQIGSDEGLQRRLIDIILPIAETRDVQVAARALGVRLLLLNASGPEEIETAFASLAQQRARAFMLSGDGLLNFTYRDQIVGLAARHATPAMYILREIVHAGGLMSYGLDQFDAWKQAGVYTGRILKGEKPADLPVQRVTKVEFVINLKTAKALGSIRLALLQVT